jgi:4-diphosphocytidyl-2-C-methyl-D-erythritol kinase
LSPEIEPVLRAEAPAKVNRELRVGGVRPDGYHEIRSRVVAIDLSDRIEVAPHRGSLELHCSGIPVPQDDSNLVARAARALAQRLGRPAEARIALQKRIPVGAGLGGGSSDAARALVLLSRLWDAELTQEETAEIAASLGSDVPFFLVGGEADLSGRGETVTPLPDSAPTELLVAVPPFAISTAEVYAAHRRRMVSSDVGRPPATLEVAASGRFFGPNDLAFAVLELRAEMGVLLDSSRSLASESAITGSGSAIVLEGVAPDAAERLAARHPHLAIHRCRTLTREEYRVRTESSGGSRWRLLK